MGSQTRKRNCGFMVRATLDEYNAIKERAANTGLTAGGFLRACALGDKGGPRTIRRPSLEIQALAKAVSELNKVGSNINQIARALNSSQHVTPLEIKRACEELSITLRAILEAAGKA